MTTKTALMRSAAFGVLIAMSASAAGQAATVHHKKVVRKHTVTVERTDGGELRELREQVRALESRLDAQSAAQAQTQAQAQQAAATAASAQQQIEEAQAQDADATAAVLQSIPVQVAAAVEAAKPKTDAFYYKGIKITPGGFLEAATIYRSKNLASDIASPFNSIPFANSHQGHEDEERFSARQSRLSFLAQGNVNPDTALAMYGEFDFLGAAQTANSNESNSYNPRIRHLYATIDWASMGLHVLAGQTWSLATMNSKGITPRNEVTPPQIDAQYVPGFVWTRTPQFRITKDFDKTLWLAVSVENPQTTFTGTVPSNVINTINNGSNFFGGGTSSGTATTQSLNHIPDVVAKAAYEGNFYGHSFHAEAFGLGRAFTDRIGTSEYNTYTGGVGGGVIIPIVPGLLDIQGSGLTGKGIGRYGSSGLPDVTFKPNGQIDPIVETDWLAGGTLHATKALDVYAFAGEEHEGKRSFGAVPFGTGATYTNAGCFNEGSAATCSAVTRFIQQETLGFWDKFYQGPFGRMQFGVQYSYTERHTFGDALGRAPIGSDSMVFTSLRYYPF